jgi:hypothetical protein
MSRQGPNLRDYLRDGYVQAAMLIAASLFSSTVGGALDGNLVRVGPYTAALLVTEVCLSIALVVIGVRRTRRKSASD